MIINAARYAMGRRSYTVAETCIWLENYWSELCEGTRRVVHQDIRDRLQQEERYNTMRRNSGKEEVSMLGQETDRQHWLGVLELPITENSQTDSIS